MKKKIADTVMKYEWAIKPDTTAILPHYTKDGFLHSLICNGEGFYEVALSPYDLMDLNLRYRGSSMRGAKDGSEILVKGRKNAVVMDKELDMIFFPTLSPRRAECAWFSLNAVVKTTYLERFRSQVNLSNGSAVTVNISKQTFDLKLHKAYELLYKVRQRNIEFEDPRLQVRSSYHLIMKENGVNYEVGSDEE